MAPNVIRRKADAVKPRIPEPRAKLSVPRPGGQGQRTTSSKAFAFKTKAKHIKGYFAML